MADKMNLLISYRKAPPPQHRQPNILISNGEQQVVDFLGDLNFLKLIDKLRRSRDHQSAEYAEKVDGMCERTFRHLPKVGLPTEHAVPLRFPEAFSASLLLRGDAN